jgi:autotransporter-associated beta strand protein
MTGNTLNLQGANTYTGATVVEVNPNISSNSPTAGLLTFSGANGAALNSPSFTINGGGALTLDNSLAAGNNNNRIGDSAAITISGGALLISGANGGGTVEDVGALSGQGAVFVTIDAGTSGNTGTTLQADSLTRVNRGQFVFRANNTGFGGTPGSNVAQLNFNTAPTLVGGGGAAGSTTISILPYAIGAFTTAGAGTDLVTYGGIGIRPLSPSEYAATIVSGASTTDNVRLAAASAITASTTVNALVIATPTPFTGSTGTLTVTSGTVLNTSAASIPAAMTLNFGASEGILFTNSSLTVDGILTGSNGLTKTGTAALNLNNPANNVTGTLTINQGLVTFPDAANLGSFSDIRINGRSALSTPGLNFAPASSTTTLNKSITITDGFMQLLSLDSSTLTLSGLITGSGGILVTDGNVELTNASNNYTGQTRIWGGILVIGSDAVLGNGGGVDIGASVASGLRLSGNWTTGRSINFSFTTLVDTNGFNWVVNSPVTGSALSGTTIITKAGAGMWTLTQGGTLGQNTDSGSSATTTTLNVNAGELRVTNVSGSATGIATVNIGSASLAATLSGTGRIAGATTIGAAAMVSPGTGSNAGTLAFLQDLTLNGTYRVDAAGDQLNITNVLTLNATSSVLDMTGASFDGSTTYTLAIYSSRTNTFATVTGLPVTHFLNYGPTAITVVPVPEPGTVLLIATAALGAAGGLRRRFGPRVAKATA